MVRGGNLGATPYNNRFNPTQRGRHALCSGGSIRVGLTAKVAPEPPFVRPFQAGRKGATASRVNRALYGPIKLRQFGMTMALSALEEPAKVKNRLKLKEYWP